MRSGLFFDPVQPCAASILRLRAGTGNKIHQPCVPSSMATAATISWTSGLWQRADSRSGKATGSHMRPAQAAPQAPARNPAQAMDNPVARRSEASATRGAIVEPDAAAILAQCLLGDSAAWAALVRAHHRRVYALCFRFTGSATDAEDLTQEVFLRIYGSLRSFDPERGSLPVWITTLTRNLLVDHFRRTRNQRLTSSLDDGWSDDADDRGAIPLDRLQSNDPGQHEQLARRQMQQMVQRALTLVSPELREAVILRDLQDMDYKEIAQVLSIPEGTVKSRISRGRAELARLLQSNRKEVM